MSKSDSITRVTVVAMPDVRAEGSAVRDRTQAAVRVEIARALSREVDMGGDDSITSAANVTAADNVSNCTGRAFQEKFQETKKLVLEKRTGSSRAVISEATATTVSVAERTLPASARSAASFRRDFADEEDFNIARALPPSCRIVSSWNRESASLGAPSNLPNSGST